MAPSERWAAAVGALGAGVLLWLAARRRAARVPLIDLAAFLEGTREQREAVSRAWDDSFRSTGFVLLVGYDSLLSEQTVRALRATAMDFFTGPDELKRACEWDGQVGYVAQGRENVGATAGKPSSAPDLVESLNLPAYQEEGAAWTMAGALHGEPPPWAHAPYVSAAPDQLVNAAAAYWKGINAVADALMELSEQALGLQPGYFRADSFKRPGTLLRLAYYPGGESECAKSDDDVGSNTNIIAGDEHVWRYGEHTDYDGFTLLQRQEVDDAQFDVSSTDAAGMLSALPSESEGGLEILFGDGRWRAVPAPKGSLTINIGDLLARWTNDRWRATPHRVAPPSRHRRIGHGPKAGGLGHKSRGEDRAGAPGATKHTPPRLSIVYFTGPHPETLVQALPTPKCGGPPRYSPVTAADHVTMKIQAAAIRDG